MAVLTSVGYIFKMLHVYQCGHFGGVNISSARWQQKQDFYPVFLGFFVKEDILRKAQV